MLQLVVLLGLGVMCEESCDLVERGETDTLYCRITYVCVRCESKGLYSCTGIGVWKKGQNTARPSSPAPPTSSLPPFLLALIGPRTSSPRAATPCTLPPLPVLASPRSPRPLRPTETIPYEARLLREAPERYVRLACRGPQRQCRSGRGRDRSHPSREGRAAGRGRRARETNERIGHNQTHASCSGLRCGGTRCAGWPLLFRKNAEGQPQGGSLRVRRQTTHGA